MHDFIVVSPLIPPHTYIWQWFTEEKVPGTQLGMINLLILTWIKFEKLNNDQY
jgi:hypothetical protein